MMNKLFLIFSISLVLLVTSLAIARPLSALDNSIFTPPTNSCAISNSCVKSGASCSGVIGDGICNSNSTNSTCCGSGLYCVNSTCMVDTEGKWCTSASQCYGMGTFVGCLNNTCTQLGFPGDDCTSDVDCLYASSVCSNDTNVCVGKAVNSSCNINLYDCDAGLYCKATGTGKNNGTCVYQIAANNSCVDGSDVCALGNICNINGTCAAGYTGGNGSKCYDDSDCSSDLFCDNTKNQCASFSAWTKTDCTNQSNCTGNSLCLCDTITGEQFCVSSNAASYCGEDVQDYLECVGSNNCSYYYVSNDFLGSGQTLNPNSCVSSNCKSDYKKINSCGCDTAKDIYGNCEQDQFCGGFPLWAIIVIAIVGVILVLVVIVVIVMVMRRRRSYDTIA